MSEQVRPEFMRADGVDDWVVLHGGPCAVSRVSCSEMSASSLSRCHQNM
jgi:hypothetical protein